MILNHYCKMRVAVEDLCKYENKYINQMVSPTRTVTIVTLKEKCFRHKLGIIKQNC